METFALNNSCEQNLYDESLMWSMVEDIDWYTKSKHHNRDTANDEVSEFLQENYSLDEVIKLENFVVGKREKLKGFINGYLTASPSEIKKNFKLSDDGFWDLCSHIVGLGRVMYSYVIEHPYMIFELQKDFVENFEYGFTAAVYEMQNE